MLRATVERLADQWPAPVEADRSLDQSLAFLGLDVDGATILAASYVVATAVVALVPLIALLVPARLRLAGTFVLLLVAVAIVLAARDGPAFVARVRRTRALGSAPTLITYATLRMRLEAVPERAASFAGATVEGPLGDSLADHVARRAGGPGTGFDGFATEWGEWFPALERGTSLLQSAGHAPASRRDALLDRARDTVLDGTRQRMASFGTSIEGPTTGIYAFGVFLPLALASLTPALRAAGVPTPVALIALLYTLVLPASLLVATVWLLSRRPLAFPPPAVDRSHPDVADSPALPLAVGGSAGATAWIVAGMALPSWTPPIAALGTGCGVTLVLAYRPLVAVRRDIEGIEDGLGDALAMIGRRVAGGTAVERAIATVAEETDGAFADVLAATAGRQRRLGTDLDTALFGHGGPLRNLDSDRLQGAGRLLSMAAHEGAPAGEAIVTLSGHLEELERVQRETRRSVESVTSTLSNTAAIFGPLVGGVTVALAGAMGGPGPFAGGGDVSGLGIAVGIYVLQLAAILTVLTTGLSRGLERSLAGYRVGLALLSATATYLAAVTAGQLIV